MEIKEIDERIQRIDKKQLGAFLMPFVSAWIWASPSDKEIFKPVMEKIMEKYPYIFKTKDERMATR